MEIYEKFGWDSLLLPCRDGDCILSPEQWRTLTVEKTHTAHYQNLLCTNDVGIVGGRANGRLSGLAFLDPGEASSLLEHNPGLADSLFTLTPGGLIVWLRAKDFMALSFRGTCLRWVSDNDVVTLRRAPPAAPDWKVGGEQVATVNVADLVLPMDPTLASHLIESGAMLRRGGRFLDGLKPGKLKLNPGFWGDFAGKSLRIRYLPKDRQFESLNPAALDWQPWSVERLSAELAEFVRQHSARSGRPFFPLGKDLSPVIEEMRVQLAVDLPTQEAGVRHFVATQVIALERSDLTTQELNQAFLRFQVSQRLPKVSTSLFELLIGPLVERQFGVRKSHSLQREGGAKRGYRGIGLQAKAADSGGTGETTGATGTSGTGGLQSSPPPFNPDYSPNGESLPNSAP
jgi:hypothetical protein